MEKKNNENAKRQDFPLGIYSRSVSLGMFAPHNSILSAIFPAKFQPRGRSLSWKLLLNIVLWGFTSRYSLSHQENTWIINCMVSKIFIFLFVLLRWGQIKKCTILKINQSLNCHSHHFFSPHTWVFPLAISTLSTPLFTHQLQSWAKQTWLCEMNSIYYKSNHSRTFSLTYPSSWMQLLQTNNFFPFLNMLLQRHYYCCWLGQWQIHLGASWNWLYKGIEASGSSQWSHPSGLPATKILPHIPNINIKREKNWKSLS